MSTIHSDNLYYFCQIDSFTLEELSMVGQLVNRTAIVTGASSGIGRAIAEVFGSEGAHVFLIGRTLRPMEESKIKIEQSSGRASIANFDIRDVAKLQHFVEEVQQQTGRLNILVNNAGVQFPSAIADANPEDWRTILETNVLALLAGCQAAIRVMRQSRVEGHIVNISSTASQVPASGVYGGTKHMVNVISATLRKELENDSIRVTTIIPGAIATNFGRNFDPAVLKALLEQGFSGELPFQLQPGQHLPEEVLTRIQTQLPQVLCNPSHIAKAVLYAVTQPIDVNIAEITVRPPRNLNI
jgi:NADP-dependent 3-hydroxy acid dehydrogenase YdfG